MRTAVQDPFYSRKKRSRKARFLEADAWLDSSLYDFFQSLGRGYTRFYDTMSIFHVSGMRRFVVEILSDGLTFGAIGAVLMLALALPAFDATASGEFNHAADYSVVFLDRYGNEIGRRGIRADDSVALDQLPDTLVKATLATEDRRFYDHFGIDVLGTARAFVSNVQAQTVVEGGSSITQQLAKNLFLSNKRTYGRKIKEAYLSLWLETHYTKDQILKMYLDRAYMGAGNFGVTAAAEYYFGKRVQDLDLAESAMLAGLFKAPTRYSPTVDLAAARGRANEVLTNLVQAGFLTEGQVTAARRNPATPIEHTEELDSPNYFLDWAFNRVKTIVAGRTDTGFIVRTTIDPALQSYAEEAANSVIRESGEQYDVSQAALVSLDMTGGVRAMVGGLDYGESQFNRAIVSNRQPGSAFKPFDYSTAFEMLGDTPDTTIVDKRVCIGNWCPENYERTFYGRVSLLTAFTHSINTVPVSLSIKTGRQPIADMAHRLGITSDFPVTRSLPLGVASVSVLDMASAYAVFPNGGRKTPAYGITSITTLRGEPVYQVGLEENRPQVLDKQIAIYMNQMMRNVVLNGTGRGAQVEGVPAAGKTGTTSSYRDAWFCGFSGNYVTAVWMGNDDYHRTRRLTGGTLPATIWQKYMEYAHTNIEVEPLLGVDFDPRPFVVEASAEDAEETEERPPTLQPAAAVTLLDLADKLKAAIAASGIDVERAEASLPPITQKGRS